MIKWITDSLGTCPYSETLKGQAFEILDVRDLVDKKGNSEETVQKKINVGLDLLKGNRAVVVCCDYGMSRSNAVAIGILSKMKEISFNEALKIVLDVTKDEIKLEVLNVVRSALEQTHSPKLKTEKKRILVLGGEGLIGQSVVPVLRLRHEVFSPTRGELDIEDSPIYLSQFCEKNNIGYILNLTYPRKWNTYASFGSALGMLRNILEVLKCHPHIHLTHISSWVVFSGYKADHLIANEETALCPEGLYAETQYFRDNLISYYMQKHPDMKIAVFRLSSCYGYGDKPKFIYNFINKALANEDIYTHTYRNAFPKLQLTHIDDVRDALGLFFEKEPTVGYYNVAGNDVISTYDIAHKIVKATASSSKIGTHKIDEDVSNIVLDTQKIRNELQWEPQIEFDAVLPALIAQVKRGKI